MKLRKMIHEAIAEALSKPKSHTITIDFLPPDHRSWYRSDIALRTDGGWFPTEALCDIVNRKYVPKPEVPSLFLGGNFGSASVGIREKDLDAAIALLKQAGHTVAMKEG